MASRSHRLRGRRKSQGFRYIVPVLIIIGLIIAIIYGRFDKDEDPNDITDSAIEANITEIETPEPQLTEDQEVVKEPERGPFPKPPPPSEHPMQRRGMMGRPDSDMPSPPEPEPEFNGGPEVR